MIIMEVNLADYQEKVNSNLPFYNLSDREFNAMVGSWPNRPNDFDLYDFFLNFNLTERNMRQLQNHMLDNVHVVLDNSSNALL